MPAENFPLQTAALVPVRIREGIRHNLVLLIFSSAPLAVGREETECADIKFLLWKTNRKIPQKNWK